MAIQTISAAPNTMESQPNTVGIDVLGFSSTLNPTRLVSTSYSSSG